MFSSAAGTILVCVAHPDDETIGAGGTIARLADAGLSVTLAVFTVAHSPQWSPETIAAKRTEVMAASHELGISDVRFFGFSAARLDTVAQSDLNDALRALVDEVRPTTIMTTHYGDVHADHRIVFDAVMVAARPLPGVSVRHVLAFECLSSSEWSPATSKNAFLPQVFVDITRTLDRKVAAMACYASEIREPPHPRSAIAIQALATVRGSTVGVTYAEAFQAIRVIV